MPLLRLLSPFTLACAASACAAAASPEGGPPVIPLEAGASKDATSAMQAGTVDVRLFERNAPRARNEKVIAKTTPFKVAPMPE